MKVEVTWADKVDGKPGDANKCAIKKAIERTYPRLKHVSVGKDNIRWSDPDTDLRYTQRTPINSKRAIVEYDAGNKNAEFPTLYLRPEECDTEPIKHATEDEKAKARRYAREYLETTGGKPKSDPKTLAKRRASRRAA